MTLAETFQTEMHKSVQQNPGDQKYSNAKSSDEATEVPCKSLRWHWSRLQCQRTTGSYNAACAGAHPLQKPEKFQAKPTYPPLEMENARMNRITMFTKLTCWTKVEVKTTCWPCKWHHKKLFEIEVHCLSLNPQRVTGTRMQLRGAHRTPRHEKNCSWKVFGKKLFKRFLTKK